MAACTQSKLDDRYETINNFLVLVFVTWLLLHTVCSTPVEWALQCSTKLDKWEFIDFVSSSAEIVSACHIRCVCKNRCLTVLEDRFEWNENPFSRSNQMLKKKTPQEKANKTKQNSKIIKFTEIARKFIGFFFLHFRVFGKMNRVRC